MKLKKSRPVLYAGLFIGACALVWLWLNLFHSPFGVDRTVGLNIYPGDTYEEVLQQIREKGKVKDMASLKLLFKVTNYPKNVHPGHYEIGPKTSPLRIVRALRSGLQTPVRLTFNNMRTAEDLAGRLSHQLMTDSATLLASFRDTTWRAGLGLTQSNYMCVFIPDTYEVWWNISPEKLLNKFVHAWDLFWDDGRQAEAKHIGLSVAEVSVLASIVEEETKKADEMPKVAGLYLNRLRMDMPLQADPTVKFAVGDFTIKRILREHTRYPSPYNTYLNTGLPPGPIRIASVQALDATLKAQRHSYIYMCAKEDFSGYHAFATTWEQHQRNAVRYRKALNKVGIMR